MTQHTPGPWQITDCDGKTHIATIDDHVCVAEVLEDGSARLIAAAPAMYEALRSCLDLLEANEGDDEWGREFVKPRADAARAAICAAQGK